jgi:hypothetical protein
MGARRKTWAGGFAYRLKQHWKKLVCMFDPDLHENDPEKELRALYEHLQARILEMIETLDELRASAEMEIWNWSGRSPACRTRPGRKRRKSRSWWGARRFRRRLEARRIQHGLRRDAAATPRGAGTGGRGAVLKCSRGLPGRRETEDGLKS